MRFPAPRAGFFLCSCKERNQRKHAPEPPNTPCASRRNRRSPNAPRARSKVSRLPRFRLRCSAAATGLKTQLTSDLESFHYDSDPQLIANIMRRRVPNYMTLMFSFRILLWAAWVCVAWFGVGVFILKTSFRVPHFLEVGILLSGSVVFVGSILAVLFLLFAARERTSMLLGISALLANVVCFATFLTWIP